MPFARAMLPILIGAVAFALVGFSWFAIVLARDPSVIHRWFSEVTRIGAIDTPPSPWYAYFVPIGWLLPWVVFFFAGIVVAIRDRLRAPLLLTFLPLIVMSFFKDRQLRYALPMIGPASIIIAIGIIDYLTRFRRWNKSDLVIGSLHWLFVGACIVALPIVGATRLLLKADGTPWFSRGIAGGAAAAGAVVLVIGIILSRRWRGGLVAITTIAMLAIQVITMTGYTQSDPGRSDMKPLADEVLAAYPNCVAYNAHPTGKRPPSDLGVYLNRVIRWVDDPASIPPSDKPAVLFMLQNKGDPEPTPGAQWTHISQAKRGKDRWHAFIRSASH